MRHLNETYESQKQIEEFVDFIIDKASKKLSAHFKKGSEDPLYLTLSPLDIRKFPDIVKYIIQKNLRNQIIINPVTKTCGFINIGSFNRNTRKINLTFPLDWAPSSFKEISPGTIASLFYDSSVTPGSSSPRDVLIHELQHAYDDWRSKGKAFDNETVKSVDAESHINYLRKPYEISARFTQTMANMKYKEGGELIPLHYFLSDFRNKMAGYEKLTPQQQKDMMRRASGFWHKKQDELKNNESAMKHTKIMALADYLKMNEDFQNPFDNDDDEPKEPKHIADAGGYVQPRKETFNLSRVEWSKRPGGDYSVIARTQFAKGEIIEICPLIILPEISKTVDRLKDIVFEIDKKKAEYGLVLGYGSLYGHSDKPNVDYAYNKRQRHMFFIANRPIQLNEELTINYGKDYWEERSNLDLMSEIPNISTVKAEPMDGSIGAELEESEVQPNASDMEAGMISKEFGLPNSKSNPAVSGVAITGLGQQ